MRYITIDNINQVKFLQVPIALIEQSKYRDLSSNDRVIYAVLLRRTQLSADNRDRFMDDQRRLFIYYTVIKMAEYLNISESTVKRSYKALEDHALIIREEHESNKSSFKKNYKTYVLYPEDGESVITDSTLPEEEEEDLDTRTVQFDTFDKTSTETQERSSEQFNLTRSESSKRSSSKKELSNKEIKNKDKNITAKAEQSSKTLFDLPVSVQHTQLSRELESMSKLDYATAFGEWRKITTTDFVHYFIYRHNELFPVKLSLIRSKEGNFLISLFKKSFLDRYQIAPEDTCSMIDKILQVYKDTETHPDYRDSFSLETFRLDWKIDKLMNDINRLEQYGSKRTTESEASGDIPEIF